jgi:hypothetical protein
VVLDLQLPDSDIESTIQAIRDMPYPVFVYTGFDDPELRGRVLRSGAEDYILKLTGKGEIIQRIGHLQYKRKADDALLQGAFTAAHEEPAPSVPRPSERSEWKGTIPRLAAALVTMIAFAGGGIMGAWNSAHTLGVQAEAQRQHFEKLDEAIVTFKQARTEDKIANEQRDIRIAELERKAQVSIDDRLTIRELDKQKYDQVLERLRNIEGLLSTNKR